MANPDHRDRLKAGVSSWNEWRRTELTLKPDLRNIDLNGADLVGCIFYRCDCRNADLGQANLMGANFHEADLRETDLRCAELYGVNFTEANLAGADLSKARIADTVFGNTDLSLVKGLNAADHLGRSIVDFRTLERSGSLPLSFLRGCGLSNAQIDYLPSLTNQAIQFYSCFISYSSKDQAFADRLHADLQNAGVRCWFAPHDMRTGDRIRDTIDQQIRLHEKLLLILSENSVDSSWVENEVEAALEKERQETALFPIRIDGTIDTAKASWVQAIRRSRHIADFENWKDHDAYQRAFDRLLRDLLPRMTDDSK